MNVYRFWTVPDNPPKNPDCFMVLSYAVESTHKLTAPTKTIINFAHQWWKKFPKSVIIMSTGDNQKLGVPNSRVMTEYGKGLGIPGKNIIEEDKSLNTYENLVFSEKIVKQKKFKNITLVMYDLHVRRALAIAKKLGWKNFSWISASSPGSPAYGWKYFQTYSRITILVYELLAYLYNLIKGEL